MRAEGHSNCCASCLSNSSLHVAVAEYLAVLPDPERTRDEGAALLLPNHELASVPHEPRPRPSEIQANGGIKALSHKAEIGPAVLDLWTRQFDRPSVLLARKAAP